MNNSDIYKTISKPSEEVLFKEKNSKFFGYAFPVTSEADVKLHLEGLQKTHHTARHFCYAYQIGKEDKSVIYRANDDGEPNNSAGMPIYGQIQSFNVTDILIVVVRYFGGVKLGVGGLISAYKTTAQTALENAKIVERTINFNLLLEFEYSLLNDVMRVIKEKNLTISSQEMEMNCKIVLTIRKKDLQKIEKRFLSIYGVKVKTLY